MISPKAFRGRITDRHRPAYHYTPPANWMNDPNGIIQWQGTYHLFYQYNPFGAEWGNIHWGHAASTDLVHWQDLPIALTPRDEEYDGFGCFTGCVVDNNGVPTAVYTGTMNHGPAGSLPFAQHACIATSQDGLISWQKYAGNPVIFPPEAYDLIGFRDHCVWREGDSWMQLIGSGIRDQGPTALLYRSDNLYDWEFLHPLFINEGDTFDDVWVGTMWECPQLLDFGERQVLLLSASHNERPEISVYLVGRYANHRFEPESAHRLDFGSVYFYAPQAAIDHSGRTLLWGWIQEGRSAALQASAGWAGVMSLPRVMTLRPNHTLGVAPAPELQALRGQHYGQLDIGRIQSNQLELQVTFQPAAERIALHVCCAANDSERTTIFYDPHSQTLGIDRSQSCTADPDQHDLSALHGQFALPEEGLLSLHIFVDRSVIELFANGAAAVTARIYPSRADSLGVKVTAAEGQLKRFDAWEVKSIWPD